MKAEKNPLVTIKFGLRLSHITPEGTAHFCDFEKHPPTSKPATYNDYHPGDHTVTPRLIIGADGAYVVSTGMLLSYLWACYCCINGHVTVVSMGMLLSYQRACYCRIYGHVTVVSMGMLLIRLHCVPLLIHTCFCCYFTTPSRHGRLVVSIVPPILTALICSCAGRGRLAVPIRVPHPAAECCTLGFGRCSSKGTRARARQCSGCSRSTSRENTSPTGVSKLVPPSFRACLQRACMCVHLGVSEIGATNRKRQRARSFAV
jgi:hypothetical protein